MPEMDSETIQVWNLYCVVGEDLLVSLDVYARRIGLPDDWEFNECLNVVNKLQAEYRKLVKDDD